MFYHLKANQNFVKNKSKTKNILIIETFGSRLRRYGKFAGCGISCESAYLIEYIRKCPVHRRNIMINVGIL